MNASVQISPRPKQTLENLRGVALQCESAQQKNQALLRGGALSSFANSKSQSTSGRTPQLQNSVKCSPVNLNLSDFVSHKLTDFASAHRACKQHCLTALHMNQTHLVAA